MPPATTNRGARSRYESSLLWRARPTSDSAACSTMRNATALLLVAVFGVAYANHVGHAQLLRLAQLAPVQERPVGRSHVLYVHELPMREDARVRRRGERVVDGHLRARGATHRDPAVQRELLPGLVAHRGDHLEPRVDARAQIHAATPVAGRGSRARVVGERSCAAAGDIAQRAARDPQEEQEQDGEEAELEEHCDGILHALLDLEGEPLEPERDLVSG